ncbi:hypothetical protein BT69DRAFT_1283791 [Atractiella rhizophila]|nr:hypothetical protein BT69DRAFT_1283791 [Atractiella rhizophila]
MAEAFVLCLHRHRKLSGPRYTDSSPFGVKSLLEGYTLRCCTSPALFATASTTTSEFQTA